jgi:broad specificity phosphatase PhoE
MRLILVRHGASYHSDRGLIAMPRGCTGLTDAGVAQAGALARRLRATDRLTRAARCRRRSVPTPTRAPIARIAEGLS